MVGFARAFGDGGSAYLADVYVLPEHRGAGLGRAIVTAMIEDSPGQRWMLPHQRRARPVPPVRLSAIRAAGHHATSNAQRQGVWGGGQPPISRGGLGGIVPRATQSAWSRCGMSTCRGCWAAVAGGGEEYRWTPVPQDEAAVRRYVEAAAAARDNQLAVPFAVVRRQDGAVIGSTRFWNLEYWAWPDPKPAPTPARSATPGWPGTRSGRGRTPR